MGDQLDEIADALIGHFVDEARRGGASWSEIGRSLGVSKQAAQQRFVARRRSDLPPLDPSQGFSRFDDGARGVVVAAQERARAAGNDVLTVNHLVLALVADADSAPARAIAGLGVSLEEVRRVAAATLPPAAPTVPDLVPFDSHAQDVLRHGFTEALRLGADLVGSEHLLLAVLAVEDARACSPASV